MKQVNIRYKNASSDFRVTLYNYSNAANNYTPIETKTINGLSGKNKTSVSFNWVPKNTGPDKLKISVDTNNEVTEIVEDNNNDYKDVSVTLPINKLELYYVKKEKSTSDPTQSHQITYYFKADHPILLNPTQRTPFFLYNTSIPIFCNAGFQAWYPWGAMWQYYSNSSDVNGTWYSCSSNPYNICQDGKTLYPIEHTVQGKGYYQYFKVIMRTKPTTGKDGVLKTTLNELCLIEKV